MSQTQLRDDVQCHGRADEGNTEAWLSPTYDAPSVDSAALNAELATPQDRVAPRNDVNDNDCKKRIYVGYGGDDCSDDEGSDRDCVLAFPPHTSAHIATSLGGDELSVRNTNHQQPPVRYDPHDHTATDMSHVSSSSVGKVHRKRIWILPRVAIPPRSLASLTSRWRSRSTHAEPCGESELHAGNGCASTSVFARTSTRSSAAAATLATEESRKAHYHLPSHPKSPALGAAPLTLPCMMSASVVRLPHPRHGQPFMCLVVRDPIVSTPTSAPSGGTFSPAADAASCSFLYEVQSQAPPSDFAQSWFVDEQVVPSTVDDGRLLVATPLDLTFFALYEFFGDGERYEQLSRTFMPAEDLYRSRGLSSSALLTVCPSGSGAGVPATTAFMSVFSDVGGCSEDSQSSSSSSSAPLLMSTSNVVPSSAAHISCADFIHQSVDRRGPANPTAGRQSCQSAASFSAMPHGNADSGECRSWNGWARAAAANPILLHQCMHALQSDGLLRRLCEVREVHSGSMSADATPSANSAEAPRTVYYKPSESVALDWLKRKIEQVRTSSVLRTVLRLPERGAVAAASTTTASTEAYGEVPMSVALGVVGEYVPDRLHAALAVACGISDLENSVPLLASAASAQSAQYPRGGGEVTGRRGGSVTNAGPVGPKSARVRRLEKAGPPKGTPTLLDMFAKKKAKKESDNQQV